MTQRFSFKRTDTIHAVGLDRKGKMVSSLYDGSYRYLSEIYRSLLTSRWRSSQNAIHEMRVENRSNGKYASYRVYDAEQLNFKKI